jgi:hypothetical protein
MQLIIIASTIIIIILCGGIWSFNSQLSLAKSNHNEEDKKTDSNNQATTTTTDEQSIKKDSDIIPIQEPAVVATRQPTTTTPVTSVCESSNTNPTCVAATNELIKEQTELEKQRMLIAQQQQEQNAISLENQRVIDNLNQQPSQDNSGSSSSKSDNENENNFSDKNLGSDTHFILMQQDGKIALFSVVSDETALDVNVLPKTIRPIQQFDSSSEALSWISNYDSR